jgi:hypothetical protein
MRTYVRSLFSIVMLAGCGSQQSLPVDPQIVVSPSDILFRTDLGAECLVGATCTDGTTITNGGQDTLTIASLTLSGDTDHVFSFITPAPDGQNCDAGVASGAMCNINRSPDSAVLSLNFTPKADKLYTATVTITSNGANDGGTVALNVKAQGRLPDGG